MIRSSRMVRSRLARMIGLVVGQLVVVVMLTVGPAWADAGTGSLRAAERQSNTQATSAPIARGDCAAFIPDPCETAADLAAPKAMALDTLRNRLEAVEPSMNC